MSSLRVRHIIWDWNGTLLDDTELCWDIFQVMVRELAGTPPTLSEFRKLFAIPVSPMWDAILQRPVSAAEHSNFVEIFHRHYILRRAACSLHSDAVEVLSELGSAGITHSIVSSHPQALLEGGVDLWKIREYFVALSGHPGEGGSSKIPFGRVHMERLRLIPEETMLIGDTVHDYDLACALGARPVLFSKGAQCPSRFESLDAPVIGGLKELLALVEI